MKKYEKAELEVIIFENEDVLTGSLGGGIEDGGEDPV